ncbi:MAG: ACP S-malonyltransferase, partial [Clostridiales Family XIII bacterium]|nr:ACP S-malonyltransferase [Clostridiales Family XIII bacterium]
MKTGIIFSGQGAQYPGMGKALYEASSAARAVMDAAGSELKQLISEGPAEELNKTDVTQPAVYITGLAAWEALKEAAGDKLTASVGGVAGFSLGEYGALTAAGVVPDFAAGLDIVRHRGAFMAEAGRYADGSPRGAMAAVIGTRDEVIMAVNEARERDVLEAVNFNSPTQVAVAGDAEALERLKTVGKARGLRVIPLKVSTAFHSPIMAPAAKRLYDYMSSYKFDAPRVKLYANTTGRDIAGGFGAGEQAGFSEFMREYMMNQLKSPVYWQETIEHMAEDGIGVFIETGPGKTLTGLVKKIAPDVQA